MAWPPAYPSKGPSEPSRSPSRHTKAL